jgi:hypothetical protein
LQKKKDEDGAILPDPSILFGERFDAALPQERKVEQRRETGNSAVRSIGGNMSKTNQGDAIIYVHPKGKFSEDLVTTQLVEAGLSDQHEMKEVKKANGEKAKLRVYQVTPEFLRELYIYQSRDRKLLFEEYIELGFVVRRWKLFSPESRKMAYGMRSLPGFSRTELRKIIRARMFEQFIRSLKQEE